MQERIIKLGRTLAKELSLDPGVDTLARWMAHYVAEQMELAKSTKGDDKNAAEQRCFETILKLWEHRSSLPNGRRPFENFEPIFRTLARLDPDESTPYFYTKSSLDSSDITLSTKHSADVQQWLDVAEVIDRVARIWIEYVFSQAAQIATDEKTITWLQNAIETDHSIDLTVIRYLKDEDLENGLDTSDEQQKQLKLEKIKSKIDQLDAFVQFSQELRTSYEAELQALMQEGLSINSHNR